MKRQEARQASIMLRTKLAKCRTLSGQLHIIYVYKFAKISHK